MKKPVKRARPVLETADEKLVKVEKNAAQKSNPKPQVKSALKAVTRANRSTPAATSASKLSAKKTVVTTKIKPESPATESAPAVRATKKRAPKDLANQYGGGGKVDRVLAPTSAPRKRRNAASRAKLQQVIAPDDGLLLRLARAGAISSSHVPENSNGAVDEESRSPTKRRSRKWETRCGKCGVNAQYSSAAALCVKCGAILVRD